MIRTYIILFTDQMDKEKTTVTQKPLRGESISLSYVFISLQHKLEYIKSFTMTLAIYTLKMNC